MKQAFTTVLQLTDLHLFAEAKGLFNGINTRDSFASVLNHVQLHYARPDVIVITGDLAHDGMLATYQFIANSLKPFNAPVYCVLGNHDNYENAHQIYSLMPITTDQHCLLDSGKLS